ncbi:MAG: AAA family ATPase, partial [Dehalococcoidia bacterium]
MDCPSCGRDNPDNSQFCNGCGVRLMVLKGQGAAPEADSGVNFGFSATRFVGRRRELDELTSCLDATGSGQGQLVMLIGEPGIGKTRTAEELTSLAEAQGFQTLWGRCYEGEGAPPYWPWVQPLRSYIQQVDPEQLYAQMGPGAADIAEIVPEVRSKLPGLEPPPPLDPEQARFRLFDSVTTFLSSAAQAQPLLLVLDDLHWADQSSLLLLEYVTREIGRSRILLVGTYRDVELNRQHPLAETLGELTRTLPFHRLLLRGLSQDEVIRFMESTAGRAAAPDLVTTVYHQTEGNPLFVGEVMRLLVQEEQLSAGGGLSGVALSDGAPVSTDGWRVRIPEGVREVIGRRLNRLSPGCNDTLIMASLIGREFGFDQLQPLLPELPRDQLMETLEEAVGVRIIEELPYGMLRYQFTHALVQETMLADLTQTRRVRLHAQIGETLEELYRNSTLDHVAELAYHFAEAETVTGTEKSIRYAVLAGEQALAAHAHEEAAWHFQRAREAKSGQPMDAELAAILSGLGRAQAATLERHRMR